jgi:hypothetical protein
MFFVVGKYWRFRRFAIRGLCGSGFDTFLSQKKLQKLNDERLYRLICMALSAMGVSDLSHLFFDALMDETAVCTLMVRC